MINTLLRSLISFLLIASFAQKSFSENSGDSVFRLAVVAPVSGNWSSYGTEIVNGAEIAISFLKEDYGSLKLIVEDACMPADAVSAARKLVNADSIHAVVGSYCVIGMVPMAQVFEREKIVAFHTSAVADEILADNTFVFTTNVTIADEARELARYVYKNSGTRAAILWLRSQWGGNYEQYFREEYQKLGGEIVAAYDDEIGTTDFRTHLSKIRVKNPDALFLVHVGAELGTALKQARQLGLKMQFFGPHESEEQVVLEIAGDAAEGLTLFSPTLPSGQGEISKFRKSYQAKYGVEPGVLASNAYDATRIIVETLHRCNANTSCVRDEIYKLKNYKGVSGTFSITSDGGTIKGFSRRAVIKGKFKPAA